MIPEERRNRILTELSGRDIYPIDGLVKSLGVSRITVQRDISLLHQRGLVHKVHGGVKLNRENPKGIETLFTKRLQQNYERKLEIANKSIQFVKDHTTVFIDSSTTCYIFAQALLKKHYLDLSIITNSPAIQQEALGHPNRRVISTGGELRQNFNMLAGRWVCDFIENINIDAAFISAAGVSSEWNITTSNAELLEILKTVLARCGEINLLADSSKFFKAAMLNIGHISQCTRVISDSEINKELLQEIRQLSNVMVVH
ncbi:MAG: DeoR/GlpR transcriptional regulator [Spirochaetota bacterium]|nr:MAG: DeoR/GlpR transcriptional regulator [Spirochaetota bacterium]